MREIKFRAWNKETKKMSEGEELWQILFTQHNNGITEGSLGASQNNKPETWKIQYEHLVFLEYIGLKDKNGVEIYEGDIVEKKTKRLDKSLPDLAERFIVKWMDCSFYMHTYWYSEEQYSMPLEEDGSPQYLDDQIFWDEDGKDMVIIGNIYQSPELLKENV